SIIDDAVSHFGTVDIVVNNAGILRDKTFGNVTMENFRAVLDVHLMGSVHVTSAAWPIMAAKGWGRVVFTSSGSGIFGNFGQANYAAAKMSVIGLMNVLKLEGIKKGIRVNCLAPGATTRMTRNIPKERFSRSRRQGSPALVSPAVLYLCSENAPNGVILQAAGGHFSMIQVCVNEGIDLGKRATYEDLLENIDCLTNDQVFMPNR
ncbi:MAG: SDR family NAD(P)-dependent oxidoreductase, partial [Pseudomonadales bacterium]|nr:SDR family NAD(P)-dependent oxidoreductase [Pseudomonadales bacterium]